MTSTHENLSCDSCRKNNFSGLRYKCLNCYDYDLCSACYEAGLTSSRHTVNHPMQCIIPKNDYDLFYSGETISSDQPQSLTCPLCGSLGFTETTLLEHVTNEHASSDSDDTSTGVVCPICGAETNQLTYDFATHLTMEHRTPRDQIEQVAIRGRGVRCHARSSGPRGRRSQPHYNAVSGSASSPSAREPPDPIVEILAQLSGVRRAGGASNQSSAAQLHQLQMHLQSSPSYSPRTNSEARIMRRTFQSMSNQLNLTSTATSTSNVASSNPITAASGSGTSTGAHFCSNQPFILMDQGSLGAAMVSTGSGQSLGANGNSLNAGVQSANMLSSHHNIDHPSLTSQYILTSCMKPALSETEQQQREILKADRSLFVQDLLLQVGLLGTNKTS